MAQLALIGMNSHNTQGREAGSSRLSMHIVDLLKLTTPLSRKGFLRTPQNVIKARGQSSFQYQLEGKVSHS